MKWLETEDGDLINSPLIRKIEKVEMEDGSFQIIAYQKREAFVLSTWESDLAAAHALKRLKQELNVIEPPLVESLGDYYETRT